LIEVTRHDNGELEHINTTEVRRVCQESDSEFIWWLIVFDDGCAVKVKDDHVNGQNPLERIKAAQQWGIRALMDCIDHLTLSQNEANTQQRELWDRSYERQGKAEADTERRHAEHLAVRAGDASIGDAIDPLETPESQIAYWKSAADEWEKGPS